MSQGISQQQQLVQATSVVLSRLMAMDRNILLEIESACEVAIDVTPGGVRVSTLNRNMLAEGVSRVKELVETCKVARQQMKVPALAAQLIASNGHNLFNEVRQGQVKVAVIVNPADWNIASVELTGTLPLISKVGSEITGMLPSLCGCMSSVRLTPMQHVYAMQILESMKPQLETQLTVKIHFAQHNDLMTTNFKCTQVGAADMTVHSSEQLLQRPYQPFDIHIEALGFQEGSPRDAVMAMTDTISAIRSTTFNVNSSVSQYLQHVMAQSYSYLVSHVKAAIDIDPASGTVVATAVGPIDVQRIKADILTLSPQQATAVEPSQGMVRYGAEDQRYAAQPTEFLTVASPGQDTSGGSAALMQGMSNLSLSGQTIVRLVPVGDDNLIAHELFQHHWSSLVTTATQVSVSCDPELNEHGVLKQIKIAGNSESAIQKVEDTIRSRIEAMRRDISEMDFPMSAICVPALLTPTVQERLSVMEREQTMECGYPILPQAYLNSVSAAVESNLVMFQGKRELTGFQALSGQISPFILHIRSFRQNADKCYEVISRSVETYVEDRSMLLTVSESDIYQLNVLAATMLVDLTESDSYLHQGENGDRNILVRGHPPRLTQFNQKWQEMCWSGVPQQQ